jgi:hypothetical protein
MRKFRGLKIALMAATFLASVSLPNNRASAISILGTSADEATRYEQLVQIVRAETQIEQMWQMLQAVALGKELIKIFEQMTGISGVVEAVMEYQVPAQFTDIPERMTPERYAALRDEAEEYKEDIDLQIAELEADISLDDEQMQTLAMAASLIQEPESNIEATQAQFLGDASRLEQQRRQVALDVLRMKRREIDQALSVGMRRAQYAAARCIRTGRCE